MAQQVDSMINSGIHNFTYQTLRNTLRYKEEGEFRADRDTRKILLNFILGKEVRPYCRADMNQISIEDHK